MAEIIKYLLHIDDHIRELIRQHGTATYAILFGVVFAETGLVVTPFLPGDTLLFGVGVFCHPSATEPGLNIWITFLVFVSAALLGDNVNYFIGRTFGHKLFKNENSRIFKKSHIAKTHAFFEKNGRKTIILARFVPVVRTFTPFVAGMGEMDYRDFLKNSIMGALLWVGIFLFAGYFFGRTEWVQQNFAAAFIAMAVISAAPMIYEIVKARNEAKAEKLRK